MIRFLAGFNLGVAATLIVAMLLRRPRFPSISGGISRGPVPLRRRPSNLLELPPLPRRWKESSVQRGNGHGGPTTPKPPIKPTPQGGLIRLDQKPDWQLMDQPGCAPKPEFPPPRVIREDFLQ